MAMDTITTVRCGACKGTGVHHEWNDGNLRPTGNPCTRCNGGTDLTDWQRLDAHLHNLSVGAERALLILGRIQEVAEALDLPQSTVIRAMSSDSALIEFCHNTNQSVDWIVEGAMRSTILALYRNRGVTWRPQGRMPAPAPTIQERVRRELAPLKVTNDNDN